MDPDVSQFLLDIFADAELIFADTVLVLAARHGLDSTSTIPPCRCGNASWYANIRNKGSSCSLSKPAGADARLWGFWALGK
jgi:hypothetical protein